MERKFVCCRVLSPAGSEGFCAIDIASALLALLGQYEAINQSMKMSTRLGTRASRITLPPAIAAGIRQRPHGLLQSI
jgi:hypothetical protein